MRLAVLPNKHRGGESGRGGSRGRTTKGCGCSSGARAADTDTAALSPGPPRGKSRLKSLKHIAASPGRLQRPILTAILRGPLHVRAERQLLFRRHFLDKMADTPLPQRCASYALFLLFATNSAALRAGSPLHLKTKTFCRVSVPSERLCGAACPYLDRFSCGELRVLSACFGSSAPLPPRLLRHLYRDPR